MLGVVASERIYSTIDRVWTIEEEPSYLKALSPREAVHVAIDHTRGVVGLQILDW